MEGKYILGNKAKMIRLEAQIASMYGRLEEIQKRHKRCKGIRRIEGEIERRIDAVNFIKRQEKPIKWTEIENRFLIRCW